MGRSYHGSSFHKNLSELDLGVKIIFPPRKIIFIIHQQKRFVSAHTLGSDALTAFSTVSAV